MTEEIWRKRYKNLNKYFPNRPINAIILGSGSLEHELGKFMGSWIVAKGGDLRVLFHQIVPHLKDFCKKLEFMKKWYFEPRKFITEVKDIDDLDEQYDMVILDSDEKIEFVKSSDPKRKGKVTRFEI